MLLLVFALGFIQAERCAQWYLRYNTLYECLDDQAKQSTRSSPVTPISEETFKRTTTTEITTTTPVLTLTTTAATTTSDALATIKSPTVTSADLTTKEISSQEPKFENTTSAAPRQRWWMSPFGIIGLM